MAVRLLLVGHLDVGSRRGSFRLLLWDTRTVEVALMPLAQIAAWGPATHFRRKYAMKFAKASLLVLAVALVLTSGAFADVLYTQTFDGSGNAFSSQNDTGGGNGLF